MNPNFKQWTEEEIKELKQRFPHRPTPCLLHVFPGRTQASINTKAAGLGLKKTRECRREISQAASPWGYEEEL
jgi:hypothetical protein